MQLSERLQQTLIAAAALAVFLIGLALPGYLAPSKASSARRSSSGPPPTEAVVVAYARKHPDPAISGPFADKLEKGEIGIVVGKPGAHALASFGPHDGKYVLTIDPAWLRWDPTPEEFEGTLSILSHEHAHYRQFVEGEMTNYSTTGRKMSEAQCTLSILVEIDAHGKACRDARAFGWDAPLAQDSCHQTAAMAAEYFLKERLDAFPECKPVWDFYAGKKQGPSPRRNPRVVGPPTRRTGAIYLPPP